GSERVFSDGEAPLWHETRKLASLPTAKRHPGRENLIFWKAVSRLRVVPERVPKQTGKGQRRQAGPPIWALLRGFLRNSWTGCSWGPALARSRTGSLTRSRPT